MGFLIGRDRIELGEILRRLQGWRSELGQILVLVLLLQRAVSLRMEFGLF